MTDRVELGLVFPTVEIGTDRATVREYGRVATSVGFDYVLIYDHVVGANVAGRDPWPGPYTIDTDFHEPFVLLSFLAGACELALMTGVVILPQRQSVLVAKQAAALDVLCGGRFRLGVGIGWNWVEYEALGVPFAGRPARFEEQITLLRRLWTEKEVTLVSDLHHVERAGLSPLPLQRPIPIWLGGWDAAAVLERIGRMGDGWLCGNPIDASTGPRYERIRDAALRAGRDPDDVGLQGVINLGPNWSLDAVLGDIASWQAIGASRISLNTMKYGRSPAEHVAVIEACAPIIDAL